MLRLTAILSVCLLMLPLRPAAGFGSDGQSERQNGADKRPLSIRFSAERVGRADLDNSEASVTFTEYSLGLNWQFLLIDFDRRENDRQENAGRAPWGPLTRIAPGLQYYGELNERWGIWGKIVAISGFENSAPFSSWTFNPHIVGLYMPRKELTFYGGIGWLYHPVDSIFYPVLGAASNMRSRTGLSYALGVPETMLKYHFNRQVALKTDFRCDIRFYRLADDNNLAPRGYIRTIDLKPGVHLEYFPTDSMKTTIGIRRFLGRGLTVFDRTKNELADHDLKDAWSFLFGIEYQL